MRFNYAQHGNIMAKEKNMAKYFFKSCITYLK